MKLEIELDDSFEPDTIGELLLRAMNPKKRWGYMTQDLAEGFKEHDSSDTPYTAAFLSYLIGDKMFWGKAIPHIQVVKFPEEYNTWAFLYWDGDGTIVFETPIGTYANTDMKKSYGWEELNEKYERIYPY